MDDYVGPDNVVRFIEAFFESLDLATAGFERTLAKATGRPGYNPGDLLKLYIYGYLNRVRSSRRLETETHRNLEVIWLMRQLQPDFKTIADFRPENKSAFRQVFREFVVLCRNLDLFGRALIAVDGTRLKAVNSGQRNFTKGKLAKAMAESDERPAPSHRLPANDERATAISNNWMKRTKTTPLPRRAWTIWKRR